MIENVNKAVCQWRATNGQPPFVINYLEDGVNKYEYFTLVYRFYQRYYELQALELL